MRIVSGSSRARFDRYRQDLRERKGVSPRSGHESATDAQGKHLQRHFRGRTFLQVLRAFLGFLSGEGKRLAVILGGSAVASVLTLVPPYGTKLVIDNVLGGRPVTGAWAAVLGDLAGHPGRLLAAVAVGMVAFSLASVTLGVASRWGMTKLSKRLTVTVRRDVFEHAVRLPLKRVVELKSGGVSSILRDDAGAVGELAFNLLYNPWKAIVQLVGVLAILATVDGRMLVGGAIFLPIVWVTHRTWIARIRPLWRDVRTTRRRVDAHATESFGGIRVVRAFGRQRAESARFVAGGNFMARQELYTWWWMRGVDIAWSVLIPVASAALLWYGGVRILQDQERIAAGTLTATQAFTVGELVMFLVYLGWLLGPIAQLAGAATGLQNNLAGLERVLDIMQEERELPDRPGAVTVSVPAVKGRVAVEGVWYSYLRREEGKAIPSQPSERGGGGLSRGEEAWVLQDVSLEAAPGSTVALVGASGAGKTTLCNLVARFGDPQRGRITLDGIDLRDLALDSYRALLGVVEQDIFLFDGSVAQNIAYSRRGATREQVVAAARRAYAHEFIERLPDGYDTFVGERGVKLSGGQRQRLSIARALLADPRILILDEATSNLDTESEMHIQRALRELCAHRTTFVIAHRLSTVMHADRIVVLDRGKVVEAGTHAALLAQQGLYAAMVQRQHAFAGGEAPPSA